MLSCCQGKNCNHTWLPLLGRFLISLIFILAGLGKVLDLDSAIQSLRKEGFDFGIAPLLIGIALLCEIGGGVLVLLGWCTRVGALILILFLLPTTFIFHDFWTYTGIESKFQMANFLKNLAIFGGLFLLMSYGPGRYSIDAKKK